MKTIGLIGYPLEHSFSNKYFRDKFLNENLSEFNHQNFEIDDISKINEIIRETPGLIGFNVTIPYKKLIIPFLDEMDETSKSIGAVNCVKVIGNENGIYLKGYNTDAFGFEESLKPLVKGHHNKALILGNGGATKAVKFVLKKLRIEYQIVSRISGENYLSYNEIDKNIIHDNKLIINTTPLGMYPNIKTFPEINYSGITSNHLLFDLIYNPEKTEFLRKGKEFGATIKNGLEMLHLQAEKSWEIFKY